MSNNTPESVIKILVVDDETDIEFLFSQKFRQDVRSGKIQMTFAFSGEHAIEIIRHKNPMDLLLLLSDINMPGMTGFELLKLVKQEFPDMKVVMVSAYGDEQNRETARKIGADGFISKPVDFNVLRRTIEELSKA